MSDRIYSFLGLAKKANKLVSGDETCERALKSGKVQLIIVAEDASDNTKKKFTNSCNFKSVDIKIFGCKNKLGNCTGKNIRSVVAILDNGFKKRLIEMIDSYYGCGGEEIVKN